MKRATNGIHASNSHHKPLDEMLRAVPPNGCITILDSEIGWYGRLRQHGRELAIVLRFYQPNWQDDDPAAWGRTIVAKLDAALGRATWASDPWLLITVANEPNLEPRIDNSEANYKWFGSWHRAVWAAIRAAVGPMKARSCWAALAAGHEPPGYPPDGEYTIPEMRAAIEEMDVLATHDYAHLDWADGEKTAPWGREAFWFSLRTWRPRGFKDARDPGGLAAQFPGKLVVIKESGTFTHNRPEMAALTARCLRECYRADAATGRCIGRTPFIWMSGPEHGVNLIWPNEPLRNALMTMPAIEGEIGATPVPDLNQMLAAELGPDYEDLRPLMADHPGFRTRDLALVEHYAIHHTAGNRNASWASIRDGHWAKSPPWSGIGYHLGIRLGKVSYLGSVELARACVGGLNHKVICICFAGDYTRIQPDPAELALARRVVKVLDAFLGRKPLLTGHGQLPGQQTACPGPLLLQHVPSLRSGVVTPPTGQPNFAKIVWFMEDAQRRCEAEGLRAESAYIGAHYTKDAKEHI